MIDLIAGSLLNNRYRIETVIARGGMGSIYTAVDINLGVRVAVKENLVSTEDSSKQFYREALILAGLHHPNLPRVTDHFVLPGQGQYLVMDFIEGEDLQDKLERQGALSEAEVIKIAVAICDALDYLHKQVPPILHRDIKPANITIKANGDIFLIDFGLAKLSVAGQMTLIGAQALTPGYAPPEQYGGGTDHRSDIYALGATLYKALTAKLPQDGMGRAMMKVSLTPVQKYNPLVSDSLAIAIERALAVDPDDRYKSAFDFKQALLNCQTEERVKNVSSQASPAKKRNETLQVAGLQPQKAMVSQPVALPLASKKSRTWGRIFALLFGTLLMSCLVGFYWYFTDGFNSRPWFLFPENMMPSFSLTQKPGAGVNTLQASTGFELHTAVILTGMGNFPQTAASSQEGTKPDSTAAMMATVLPPGAQTQMPQPVHTHTRTASTLNVSEAGQPLSTTLELQERIAFASDRSGLPQIWLVDENGLNLLQVTEMDGGACQPDWSPDGSRLVFVSPCSAKQESGYEGSHLYLLKLETLEVERLNVAPAAGEFDPAWSPDGSMIALVSVGREIMDSLPHLYLYRFEDSSLTGVSTNLPVRFPAWAPDSNLIVLAYPRQHQLWMVNLGVEDSAPFDFSVAEIYAYDPAWSPDGAMIAFGKSKNPMLAMKAAGSRLSPEYYVSEQFRPVSSVDFSRDGKWLVFDLKKSGFYSIYMVLTDGGEHRVLDEGSWNSFDPAWQP